MAHAKGTDWHRRITSSDAAGLAGSTSRLSLTPDALRGTSSPRLRAGPTTISNGRLRIKPVRSQRILWRPLAQYLMQKLGRRPRR